MGPWAGWYNSRRDDMGVASEGALYNKDEMALNGIYGVCWL